MAEIITLHWIAPLPSSIESLTSLRRTTIVITLRVWVAMWIIRTASSSKMQIPRKLISSASNSVVICLIVVLDFARSFACFFQNSHVVHKLIQREGSIRYAPTNYSKLESGTSQASYSDTSVSYILHQRELYCWNLGRNASIG